MRTLLIGLVMALAAPAATQTSSELLVMPSKNSIRTYVFTQKDQTGKTGIRGKVKKVHNNEVFLTIFSGPATWDQRYKLDVFTPVSAFRIMQVVTPDTGAGQLGLAKWGIAHDVPVQAKYALRMARRFGNDPTLGADLDKQIRDKIAAQLQQRFKDNPILPEYLALRLVEGR